MTDTQTKNTPKATLRDGAIKATIWANPMKEGDRLRYSVEFSRSYRDQAGEWNDSGYFSRGEILRVAHLAQKAYDAIAQLRAEESVH